MLTAEMIPSFTDKTPAGARMWWDAMLKQGLYIHPEDDPTDTVAVDTGERMLDGAASAKVTRVYEDMFETIGESATYETGQAAWFHYQGYEWDEASNTFKHSKNH